MRRSRHNAAPRTLKITEDFIYVNIERETSSGTNMYGEPDNTEWTPVSQNTKCSFSPTTLSAGGDRLIMTSAGQASISDFLAIFERGVDIQARDRIVDIDSNAYRVTVVRGYGTHVEADCDTMELD